MITSFLIVVVSGFLLYLFLKPPTSLDSEESQPPVLEPKPVVKYAAPSVRYMAATLKQNDPVFERQPVMKNTSKSMAKPND
ncbi:hypothetical protein [Brevibacillus nitrificans]|uniref:hypothetical protein n=1 Tax=Brevibacillus nitrificans TaxID=651560 RepID=UPI0028635B4F|nr:hypothetical protein [Brevibacillus nitrificans]MDR7314669.1 hypothetical protein [Brevibacillus nitrificans]